MQNDNIFSELYDKCFDDKLSIDYQNYEKLITRNINIKKEIKFTTTKKLPDNYEKSYIIPKEWLEVNNINEETIKQIKHENEIILPSVYYFHSLILLQSYFKNHINYKNDQTLQQSYILILNKIKRLLRIWVKNKYPNDIRINNTYKIIYIKIKNNISLSKQDYQNIHNLLNDHYKNKSHKKEGIDI